MNLRLFAAIYAACFAALLPLRAQVPQLINYQGRVVVGTTNFNGTGQLKFALVNGNGSTTYWSNDGTSNNGSEPTNAVSLTVANGLYSVLLGDTSLTNMTVAIPTSVFNNSDVRLRVWFNDGAHGSQLLTPDQRIAAVGYAVMAAAVPDGSITNAKVSSVDASKITGTLPTTVLPATVARLDQSQTFSSSIAASSFSGDGSAITNVNALELGGVAANQYILTNDSRLFDARSPTSGSASYIQNNTTSPQSASFNISGNGVIGGTLSTRIAQAASAPATSASDSGRLYFDTTLNALRVSNGSAWDTLATIPQNMFVSSASNAFYQIDSSVANFTTIASMGISAPASGVLCAETDGAIQTFSGTPVVVDVALFVDGNQVAQKRVEAIKNTGGTGYSNWSFSGASGITVGNHSVEVKARWYTGASATINSGDPYSGCRIHAVFYKQ